MSLTIEQEIKRLNMVLGTLIGHLCKDEKILETETVKKLFNILHGDEVFLRYLNIK